MADLARRVLGLLLLAAAIGFLLLWSIATRDGTISSVELFVVPVVAGGLAAAGVNLVLWPMGRQRR